MTSAEARASWRDCKTTSRRNRRDGLIVVKVRRPDALERVDADLALIRRLAQTARRRWALADRYDVIGLAEEFANTLRAELDYVRG